MTMGHLMIEWNKLQNFLLAFAWQSKCAWGHNPLRWEVPLTRLKSMVTALGTHRRAMNPCQAFSVWELQDASQIGQIKRRYAAGDELDAEDFRVLKRLYWKSGWTRQKSDSDSRMGISWDS